MQSTTSPRTITVERHEEETRGWVRTIILSDPANPEAGLVQATLVWNGDYLDLFFQPEDEGHPLASYDYDLEDLEGLTNGPAESTVLLGADGSLTEVTV
jgi:hypothetical protein